jgi:hypothetical protein
MSQFGLTEWEDVEVGSQNREKKNFADTFLKLQQGSNVLRIITKPHEFLVHQYKPHEKDPGFGVRILSSQAHGKDPLVEMGLRPKRRWYVGVIDRKTASYKVLEISSVVLKSIQSLVRDEDWGDPSQYDIDIKVDKNGGAQGYYSVVAKPKKPLTQEDIDIKASVDLEQLKRLCSPPTYEQVLEKVKMAQSKSPNFNNDSVSRPAPVVDDEDDDTDFPAA